MRRTVTIGVLAAACLAAAACSSGGGGGGPTTTTTTASGGPTTSTAAGGAGPTAAQLEGALLQPAQMPGWTVSEGPTTQTSDPATRDGDVLCPAGVSAYDSATVAIGNPEAQVTYEQGPVQLVEVVQAAPAGQATAVLAAYGDALAACNGQTWTQGTTEWTGVLPVSPPVPGSSTAYRLVGTSGGEQAAVVFLAIAVERQDVVIELIVVEPGGSGVDQATMDRIVADAVAGVEAL